MDEGESKFFISYETLFDLARNEKNKEELQKLPEDFYDLVAEFMAQRLKTLKEEQQRIDLYSVTEKEALLKQINNIKKIIRDIYERREKKIMLMALIKARTGTSIIDTTSLLDVEKKMYQEFIDKFKEYRANVLDSILAGNTIARDKDKELIESLSEDEMKEVFIEKKRIKLLQSVPKFLGTDLKEYGPYEEEDIIEIPVDLAEVLISKQRAVEIK